MPELPEVHTMVEGLRPALVGRTIVGVRVNDPYLLKGTTPRRYRSAVVGKPVEAVELSGKWVLIRHGSKCWTLIQPRMTGGFRVGDRRPPARARIGWTLDRSPYRIWYTDLRRIGVVMLLEDSQLRELLARKHGPDALSIDARTLGCRLARTTSPVKAALMKQELVAGLGNIYSEEALFRAGIRPDRPANSLSREELRRLARAIRTLLRDAIACQGTSFRDYRTASGRPGRFQDLLCVYHRAGQPCRRCGQPVERMKMPGVANRYTHFCPRCQK